MLTNKLPLPAIAHVVIDDSLLHYVDLNNKNSDRLQINDLELC